MGANARSAHGTLIAHQPGGTGAFNTISEIGDIGDAGTTRNSTDVSVHNEDIDTFVRGILRRADMTFPINWVAADESHQALLESHYNNATDGFSLTFPDGDVIIFSGGITGMTAPAPVDGALRRNVTIRPSGLFSYNGINVGVVGTPFALP